MGRLSKKIVRREERNYEQDKKNVMIKRMANKKDRTHRARPPTHRLME